MHACTTLYWGEACLPCLVHPYWTRVFFSVCVRGSDRILAAVFLHQCCSASLRNPANTSSLSVSVCRCVRARVCVYLFLFFLQVPRLVAPGAGRLREARGALPRHLLGRRAGVVVPRHSPRRWGGLRTARKSLHGENRSVAPAHFHNYSRSRLWSCLCIFVFREMETEK